MPDALLFAVLVALAGTAVVFAVLSQQWSARVRIPAPAFFLVASALVALVLPTVAQTGRVLDERIVSIALVFILFDGGMRIGWRRFRASAGAIACLGVAGTIATAAAITVAAHVILGTGWQLALLLGAALSPTDPAVVFSVLGRREISGRIGTILEGESGANDPVSISMMAALLATGVTGWQAVGQGLIVFLTQMGVGAMIGIIGGLGLKALLSKVHLPNEALASVLGISAAALIFGATQAAQGSGFLAVFVTGILVGDASVPYKSDVVRFTTGVASLAEIVAFIVLGLTIRLDLVLRPDLLMWGLILAAVLIFLIRPVLIIALSLPFRLRWGERMFLGWTGLKGAVPILLGLTIVSANVNGSQEIYAVIFVVVLVSVLLQGSSVPGIARMLNVPMREVERHPYVLDIRFARPPTGLHRYVVESGSPADGAQIGDLMQDNEVWVSLASRGGHHLRIEAGTVLHGGDVVMVQSDEVGLAELFAAPT
jgi:cell volume regulation protein A